MTKGFPRSQRPELDSEAKRAHQLAPFLDAVTRFSLIWRGKTSNPTGSMEKNRTSSFRPLRRILFATLLVAAVAAVLGGVASSRAVNRPNSPAEAAALRKVAPWVIEHTANGQQAEFMIILADQ